MNYTDLSDFVDVTNVECLNEKPMENIVQMFRSSTGLLQSDTDEQLLMNIPFRQAVKVHSIVFVAPNDGRRPHGVKFFVNNRIMDFSIAEDSNLPTQQVELKWEQNDGRLKAIIQTKFVKFQDVNNICIFIQSNAENVPTTAVHSITFVGAPLQKTLDISELKKQQGWGCPTCPPSGSKK